MLICLVNPIAATSIRKRNEVVFHMFVPHQLNRMTIFPLSQDPSCKLKRSVFFYGCASPKLSVPPEWNQSSNIGGFSSKFKGVLAFIPKEGKRGHPKPGDVTIGSTTYYVALPAPAHTPKLQKYVDITEMTRGPKDTP